MEKDEKREKLKGGIFITPHDILAITGASNLNYAQQEHRQVRDALGKKSKRLSIKDYCDYWELDYDEIVNFLISNR